MTAPDSERALAASIGSHAAWANTRDRTARTAPGRAAFQQQFLDAAGGDPVRAAHLRTAHYRRLQLASARSRRKAREALDAAEAAEAAIAAMDAGEPTPGGPL